MDLSYIYIGIGGLLLGLIFSVVLNVYSKSSASSLTYSFFGMNVMTFIAQAIFFGLGLTIAVLAGFSVLVRDLSFPRASPIAFTIETLLMASLCSCIIFVMTILRGYTITSKTWIEFTALFIKFGLLHILLQFSGVYSEIFPYKNN